MIATATGVDAALNLTLPSDRLTAVARAVRPGGRRLRPPAHHRLGR
ncbi:hypothetical protein [Actinomadura xylanilytica]|nr:hypothetical protein [Actinomadura xylanilytica]MDL4771330.1 hypothetical protein [Actinomadura xylanilytica]